MSKKEAQTTEQIAQKSFIFLKDVHDGRFKFKMHEVIQMDINDNDLKLSPAEIDGSQFSLEKKFILLQIIKKGCQEFTKTTN